MIPELIFWWALAVMASVAAAWILAASVIAIRALFKPRGKMPASVKAVRSTPIEQVRAEIKRRQTDKAAQS